MSNKVRTRDFGNVIRNKLAANPQLAEAVQEQSFNADIAQQIYDLRRQAGLTQTQLAKLADTQQSVISRIEDSDYDGHSLTTLKRIAKALKRRLRVEFSPEVEFSAERGRCETIVIREFAVQWFAQESKWEPTISGIMPSEPYYVVVPHVRATPLEHVVQRIRNISTSLVNV